MDKFMEVLNIDEMHILDQVIFKKYFYDSEILNSSDKKLIKNNIANLKLTTILKPELIKIPAYEDENIRYLEIALVEVNLLKKENQKKIAEIINKTIQYPSILFFRYSEEISLSLCEKRLDKVKGDNNIIVDILLIEDINKYHDIEDYQISIMYLNNINLYKYYMNLLANTYALKLSKDLRQFHKLMKKQLKELRKVNLKMENINNNILTLKNKIKQEEAIGRRVELNVNLKKQEKMKEKLINKVMEA